MPREVYTNPDAILTLLAGVDTDDWTTALEAAGTTLRDHMQQVVLPYAANHVDAYCGRDFLPHDDDIIWVQGNDTPNLTLSAAKRPVREVEEATIYSAPGMPWVELTKFAYMDVDDGDGGQLRDPATREDFGDAEVLVRCMLPQLVLPPGVESIAVTSQLGPQWRWAWLDGGFPNVYIAYSWGYATPPSGVAQACANFATICCLSSLGDLESKGLASWSLGDESRSWGQVGAGSIQSWLSPYVIGGPHSALANRLLAEGFLNLRPHKAFGVGV